MKNEIQNCFVWLVNKVSETTIYDWSDDFIAMKNKEFFDKFNEEMRKHIDFTKLTAEEAKELRFKKWSEDRPNLWLFPLYLTPIIPDRLEITYIDGEKGKYQKGKMDDDIRYGCVSYGIEINN